MRLGWCQDGPDDAMVNAANEALDLRERIAAIHNALARLDGHTCHEEHTDAEHLAMYRTVVEEIRAAVGGWT